MTGFNPPAPGHPDVIQAMATVLALLAGVLISCLGDTSMKNKLDNGDRCFHHSQCYSTCCLLDLDRAGAFCSPRARRGMSCLPQTRAAINFICPCRMGMSCTAKDAICPRRCHLI